MFRLLIIFAIFIQSVTPAVAVDPSHSTAGTHIVQSNVEAHGVAADNKATLFEKIAAFCIGLPVVVNTSVLVGGGITLLNYKALAPQFRKTLPFTLMLFIPAAGLSWLNLLSSPYVSVFKKNPNNDIAIDLGAPPGQPSSLKKLFSFGALGAAVLANMGIAMTGAWSLYAHPYKQHGFHGYVVSGILGVISAMATQHMWKSLKEINQEYSKKQQDPQYIRTADNTLVKNEVKFEDLPKFQKSKEELQQGLSQRKGKLAAFLGLITPILSTAFIYNLFKTKIQRVFYTFYPPYIPPSNSRGAQTTYVSFAPSPIESVTKDTIAVRVGEKGPLTLNKAEHFEYSGQEVICHIPQKLFTLIDNGGKEFLILPEIVPAFPAEVWENIVRFIGNRKDNKGLLNMRCVSKGMYNVASYAEGNNRFRVRYPYKYESKQIDRTFLEDIFDNQQNPYNLLAENTASKPCLDIESCNLSFKLPEGAHYDPLFIHWLKQDLKPVFNKKANFKHVIIDDLSQVMGHQWYLKRRNIRDNQLHFFAHALNRAKIQKLEITQGLLATDNFFEETSPILETLAQIKTDSLSLAALKSVGFGRTEAPLSLSSILKHFKKTDIKTLDLTDTGWFPLIPSEHQSWLDRLLGKPKTFPQEISKLALELKQINPQLSHLNLTLPQDISLDSFKTSFRNALDSLPNPPNFYLKDIHLYQALPNASGRTDLGMIAL